MSDELVIYRKNKINNLYQQYVIAVNKVYANTVKQINYINRSRITYANKRMRINNWIAIFYTEANRLQTIFEQNKSAIEKYTPPKVIISGNKKALLVGINYTGTSDELYGCINDVNSIKDRIAQNGFTDADITTLTDLTDNKPTKHNILSELEKLLVNSKEGDLLFFSYSGHGSYTLDRNGDEVDGYDELLVSSDLQGVTDDELKLVIQTHLKENVTLFAMIDSCYSGSVLDLKYQYIDSLNYDEYTENDKQLDTVGNVFMISGCTDEQTSADAFINNKYSGAMTWSLLEALKETPNCKWRELIKSMRDKLKQSEYEQVPQFSSGTFVNIDDEVFI